MLLEYLFFDMSKRQQVETFNHDLKERLEKAKKADLLPDITYKDFDKADYWIVRYEKPGNNDSVAKQLSEINERICEDFSPTILTNESSEYFNKSLYPRVNRFERYLRKLLYLKVSLCNEEKLKSIIRDIENKDFGEIYSILFIDSVFRSAARDKIKKLNTRSEMFEAIESLNERTVWDILIGKSDLAIIKDNFDLLKDYRNDVMHAHNISYSRYKAIKKLFSSANSELEAQIGKIIQYPSTTMVPLATIDTLYDKLVAFSNDAKKISNNISQFVDLFAKLSAPISQETLTGLERFAALVIDASAKLAPNEDLSSEDASEMSEEVDESNEGEAKSHE